MVAITCTTSPSARCASATKLACMDIRFFLILIHFHRYKRMFLVRGLLREKLLYILFLCLFFIVLFLCICVVFVLYCVCML